MSYSLKNLVQFDSSLMSAFGTLETAELFPAIQLDFVYGINSQFGVTTIANSATVDTSSSRLRLQSGTNSAGSAIFNSKRSVKYRPGQGTTARFTAVFNSGVASNTQIVGCGNSMDGFFFGYNGTSYGILQRANSVDTWIAQASWNGDKADGSGASAFTINPQLGNVYMIKYPYLGYGNVQFFIQDSATSRWILVHTIKYTNSSVTTEVVNPNFFFYAQSLNAGSTTNVILYVGSAGIFVSGERSFIADPKWAMDSNKSIGTTETCLLNLQNCTSYNTVTNRSLIRLNSISFASDNSTVTILKFKLNATIGGTPSYTAINGSLASGGATITSGNSIASFDIAGTTVSGGNYIFNISIEGGSTGLIDLTPYHIFIAPGDILTLSAVAAIGATAQMGLSLNWSEDI